MLKALKHDVLFYARAQPLVNYAPVKTEIATSFDLLESLRSEWDALALHDPRDGFFRSASWYLSWMRWLRPDCRPQVILVRAADGKIVGLAPLCGLRFNDLGFSLRSVGFGGREVVSGDFLDVLSVPELRPQVLAAVLECLSMRRDLWSMLIFGEMLVGGDLHAAVEAWALRNGYGLRRQEERICPYAMLPETFDQYLSCFSPATRYHIRRRTRDLLERQGARIETCSDPAQVSVGVDLLVRLHVARWGHVGEPGTLGRPGFASFLRQLHSSPPAGATCKLYLLKHDGSAVAALLVFHFGPSALYYQAGWDPESPLHRFSPGVVLMAHSIRDAISNGVRYYEFLQGDEAYKFHWTTSYRKTNTLLVARTLAARAYLGVRCVTDAFRPVLPRLRPSKALVAAATEGVLRAG